MLPEASREIGLLATWGDYRVEAAAARDSGFARSRSERREEAGPKPQGIQWVRSPARRQRTFWMLDVTRNASGIPLPGSAAPQRPGGGLEVRCSHQRIAGPGDARGARPSGCALSRCSLSTGARRARAPYGDLAYAFQAPFRAVLPDRVSSRVRTFRPTIPTTPTCVSPTCTIATCANTPSAAIPPAAGRSPTTAEPRPVTRVWTDPTAAAGGRAGRAVQHRQASNSAWRISRALASRARPTLGWRPRRSPAAICRMEARSGAAPAIGLAPRRREIAEPLANDRCRTCADRGGHRPAEIRPRWRAKPSPS